MNVILQVIQKQWIFILLAAALIGLFYYIKAKKPEIFKKFAIAEFAASIVLLVVFALFGFQDLFLLAPIILISCEIFGYVITGKIVGVLLVDYLLIIGIDVLYRNGAINDLFDTVLFYALQLVTAIVVGILLDNHIRAGKKAKTQKVEELKDQERLQRKQMDEHVNEIFAKYAGKISEADEAEDEDEADEPDDGEEESKYSFDAAENAIFSSSQANRNKPDNIIQFKD